jgi:acyl-CoA reductase-like NAD-dependent aldehyde dehydrogenase
VADASDLPLLRSWFKLFKKQHPDDHSSVEFVVDHPLGAGAIVVWDIYGRPVALASRTPEMAGMTRMGLAFQPAEGTTYSEAAFVSACVEAAKAADHVLVLSGTPSSTGAYVSLGFVPVLDRVLLEVLGERAS